MVRSARAPCAHDSGREKMLEVTSSSDIVVVDAGPFLARSSSRRAEAQAIRHACRDCGFFYVSGHGVSETLLARLEAQSHAFFALPLEQKLAIRMARGGRAWRGYSRSAAS